MSTRKTSRPWDAMFPGATIKIVGSPYVPKDRAYFVGENGEVQLAVHNVGGVTHHLVNCPECSCTEFEPQHRSAEVCAKCDHPHQLKTAPKPEPIMRRRADPDWLEAEPEAPKPTPEHTPNCDCPVCRMVDDEVAKQELSRIVVCWRCEGTGKTKRGHACGECGGKGKLRKAFW